VTTNDDRDSIDLAEAIGRKLKAANKTAAVAESVTGGQISSALSAGGGASEWFAGGLVAYASHVKFGVLGVEPGPVITERCAEQMAAGVARLLKADVAVSTTGAGGPGPEEGRPPGTVFIAVVAGSHTAVRKYEFGGEPAEVVRAATVQALRDLAGALTNGSPPRSPGRPT
jgi:nicotinamide-nucleotide amidase